MKRFGLIGKTLGYSFSKGYFTLKFKEENLIDHVYELIELDCIDQLMYWLIENGENLIGLNVTIPYKEAIIPYLDYIDTEAKAIGAVNTIRYQNNSLHGYNTDVYGFSKSLTNQCNIEKINTALILGTGGASKAVAYALAELNISCQKVSRSPNEDQVAYESLNERKIQKYDLIINTTPLGTYPDVDHAPCIPYQGLKSNQILFDLIYNPAKTLFLERGLERGCQIVNGLEMLHLQAEKAWEIWTTNEGQ